MESRLILLAFIAGLVVAWLFPKNKRLKFEVEFEILPAGGDREEGAEDGSAQGSAGWDVRDDVAV